MDYGSTEPLPKGWTNDDFHPVKHSRSVVSAHNTRDYSRVRMSASGGTRYGFPQQSRPFGWLVELGSERSEAEASAARRKKAVRSTAAALVAEIRLNAYFGALTVRHGEQQR